MANNMIFCDGFELNSTELWDTISGAAVAAAQTGMSGSYCLSCAGGNHYVQKDFGANKSELWFGFRVRPTINGAFYWTAYDSGGTPIFSLIRNTGSGRLEARLGAYNGALQATGSGVLNINTTYLVEIHFKPLNSGGVCQVKIDGNAALDIDFSGDTTNGLENCRQFRLAVTASYGAYYDDVIVDDGDWIGNKKIAAIVKPSGAGTTTEWDPSAGANYECVDEIPPSDTDYNATNVTDEIDLFACNDIAGATISSIYGIQVNVRCAKEGSPTPTDIQAAVRTGGSNYFSGNLAPGVSFAQRIAVWMNNPNTINPWTESEINGLELGYKAVA